MFLISNFLFKRLEVFINGYLFLQIIYGFNLCNRYLIILI